MYVYSYIYINAVYQELRENVFVKRLSVLICLIRKLFKHSGQKVYACNIHRCGAIGKCWNLPAEVLCRGSAWLLSCVRDVAV